MSCSLSLPLIFAPRRLLPNYLSRRSNQATLFLSTSTSGSDRATQIQNEQTVERPRASNPTHLRKHFPKHPAALKIKKEGRKKRNLSPGSGRSRIITDNGPAIGSIFAQVKRRMEQDHAPATTTLQPALMLVADHLKELGENIPESNWIEVRGIKPISSLQAVIMAIEKALNVEQERGILDLEAEWNPKNSSAIQLPLIQNLDQKQIWVRKALIILSPFGRPSGWRIELPNRSVARALLQHANENDIFCASQKLQLSEFENPDTEFGKGEEDETPFRCVDEYDVSILSDATVRVENCPVGMNPLILMNLFSRYDLLDTSQSSALIKHASKDKENGQRPIAAIEEWKGTIDGSKVQHKPNTWLVHFADASWARAAVRERQATVLRGSTLLLAQYPKQLL